MRQKPPRVAVLALLLAGAFLLAGACAGLSPATAQGGPNSLPLPNPNLDNLPRQREGLSLGGGVTLSPGVGIQDGFTEDAQDPAPMQDAGSTADMGGPALGAGEDTDMGSSGATISIPFD